MNSGFVFVALAIIAIITNIWVALKGSIRGLTGWVGLLLMTAGAIAVISSTQKTIEIIAGIIFAVGFLVLAIAAGRAIITYAKVKNNHAHEIGLRTISDILHVAATRESLLELLNYSLDRFLEICSLNSGAIYIHHAQKNTLVMGAFRGLSPIHANKLELVQPGQTAIGRALQNKRVLIIRDLKVSPDYGFFGGKTEGYSFLAVAPIMVDNDCWGVITILGRKKYHRGMLDVSLLEQFGIQLGQALQLGRQNRQIAGAFNQQKVLLGFYDKLFEGLKAEFSEESLLRALESYPEKLFGGQAFWIFRKINDNWGYFYSRGLENYADLRESIQQLRKSVIDKLTSSIKPNELFGISRNGFDKAFIAKSFIIEKLSCMAFAENGHLGGLLIINQLPDVISKTHFNDISVIKNMMNIIFAARGSLQTFPAMTIDSGKLYNITDDLANIFTGITGNVQLLHQELLSDKQSIDSSNMARWLRNLEDSIARGTKLIEETSHKVNPNELIQSVIESDRLNVIFYPASNLPHLKTDAEEFKDVINAIIQSAIDGERPIKLRTAADSDKIALTIEGKLKADFLSDELIDRALRQNINIRLSPDIIESAPQLLPPEKGFTGNAALNILVVENKKLIQDLLTDLFASIGYRFTAKSSGREAMTYLLDFSARGETIDTVVVDMALDDITGLRLCQKIKEFDNKIHTIIISSWGVNLTANTLKDAGVDAVLYKPFRLEQLRQVLPQKNARNESQTR